MPHAAAAALMDGLATNAVIALSRLTFRDNSLPPQFFRVLPDLVDERWCLLWRGRRYPMILSRSAVRAPTVEVLHVRPYPVHTSPQL